MSHKIKSTLYFASLVLALITYYHIDSSATTQNNELADNAKNVSTIQALK